DQHVEVLSRFMAESSHVVVPAITSGCDDSDTRHPPKIIGALQSITSLADKDAEHDHSRHVVAVVDDDGPALDTDLVEAAGGEVVVGGEGTQALPDIVQRGTRCE